MKTTGSADKSEKLLGDLATLYIEGNPYLSEYAWHWESERWHEMLSCALIASGLTADKAREAVRVLVDVELDSPIAIVERLRRGKPSISSVLVGIGVRAPVLSKALRAIRVTAEVCSKAWAGSPQRFLRKQGQLAITALSRRLRVGGMPIDQSRHLATLWLQNVANVPVLAEQSPEVKSFCKRYRVTPEQVVAAADRVGINVAIIDELILMSSGGRRS